MYISEIFFVPRRIVQNADPTLDEDKTWADVDKLVQEKIKDGWSILSVTAHYSLPYTQNQTLSGYYVHCIDTKTL